MMFRTDKIYEGFRKPGTQGHTPKRTVAPVSVLVWRSQVVLLRRSLAGTQPRNGVR